MLRMPGFQGSSLFIAALALGRPIGEAMHRKDEFVENTTLV